jgi:hypothetical protein
VRGLISLSWLPVVLCQHRAKHSSGHSSEQCQLHAAVQQRREMHSNGTIHSIHTSILTCAFVASTWCRLLQYYVLKYVDQSQYVCCFQSSKGIHDDGSSCLLCTSAEHVRQLSGHWLNEAVERVPPWLLAVSIYISQCV